MADINEIHEDEPKKKKRGRKKNIYNTEVQVVSSKDAGKKNMLSIQSTGNSQISFNDIFKVETPDEDKVNSQKKTTMTAQDRSIINGLNKVAYVHRDLTNDSSSNISSSTHLNEMTLTDNSFKHINDSCSFGKEHYERKTNVLCWYCCHCFDTYPIPLPVSVKRKVNGDLTFNVKGNFCTFNCAKSYANYNERCFKSYEICSLLSSLHKVINGKIISIRCAPKRELLSAFGGKLDIETFRLMSGNNYSKMIMCPHNIIPINMKLYESNPNQSNNSRNESMDVNTNNLVLYRKKPNKNKNTLEAVMGIKKISD